MFLSLKRPSFGKFDPVIVKQVGLFLSILVVVWAFAMMALFLLHFLSWPTECEPNTIETALVSEEVEVKDIIALVSEDSIVLYDTITGKSAAVVDFGDETWVRLYLGGETPLEQPMDGTVEEVAVRVKEFLLKMR